VRRLRPPHNVPTVVDVVMDDDLVKGSDPVQVHVAVNVVACVDVKVNATG